MEALLELRNPVVGQQGEDLVGLHRKRDLDAFGLGPLGESGSHRVGAGRASAPQVALIHRGELRGDEAHLARELARLLADVGQRVGERGAQQHDRLAGEHAVLGAAERQHVDARLGGQRRDRRAHARRRVGDPRTVHVQQHAARVGQLRQFAQLAPRVDGAELGDVGDRDDARLGVVLEPETGERGLHQLRRQFAVGRGDGDQLDVGDMLGRAALISGDVRTLGTDDALPRLADRCESDHVGAGAVPHEGDLRFLAQQELQRRDRADRPLVVAVRVRVTRVRLGDCREHLGVHACVVVAAEASPGHARSSLVMSALKAAAG